MKLKIDFLYEKVLTELLTKKNKTKKRIYVFYDSDLVNFNSAYICLLYTSPSPRD